MTAKELLDGLQDCDSNQEIILFDEQSVPYSIKDFCVNPNFEKFCITIEPIEE